MSKKDPPEAEPPPAPQPGSAPAVGFAELMEALAAVSTKMQGVETAEIGQQVAHLKEQVASLGQAMQERADDVAGRAQAAASVEQLIEAIARTGTATGRAVEKQRAPIQHALHGVDLSHLAAGLRLFADYLANPTEENQQQARQVIEKLQETVGPMFGWDPKREEEERRAEIKRDVRASLDEIFRGVKKD
jgi:uncharacterized protein YoxC